MRVEEFLAWLHLKNRKPALLMGILNITPDSFYGSSRVNSKDAALYKVESMIAEGVDLIDIGGESTRPNALPISLEEELERVIPIIEAINANYEVAISIDTYKPIVMREAVLAGGTMINDVRGLEQDGALETVARLQVPVCVLSTSGFDAKIKDLCSAGILLQHIILDPGFGFTGKGVNGDLKIMSDCQALNKYEVPVLLGVSRKSTIGTILDKPVDERLYGSLALASLGLARGVSIIRAHDIKATRDTIDIFNKVFEFEASIEVK